MSFCSVQLAAAASLAASALLVAMPAAAQTPPIKAGLWEIRSESAGDPQKSAQAAERMKNLPPEVRAKIEATMKERGIDMMANGATRVCFSKESMDISQWQNQSSCKTDFTSRSGSSWKWHAVCAQPPAMSDGEAVFTNAESYTINTSTTMTLRGETKTTQRTMKAKWIGGSCGDLKPFHPKR
ncbi:MAG: DUF3617 domain-containing protein [Pseudomonadota bacterium]|nr:DUF3617 domain-containing protein [Pseudomonadota bacterium]